MSAPDRDLSKLDPTFRARVDKLIGRMHVLGHDARVWEAFRSFERAEELQRRGQGVSRSMHCYGVAVDIISASKYWDPPGRFWDDLGRESETLGMTWGGRWERVDKPHVQAVHVSDQEWVRQASRDQIAELVIRRLGEPTMPDEKPTAPETVRAKSKPPPGAA